MAPQSGNRQKTSGAKKEDWTDLDKKSDFYMF